jgi:hypothetical protein
MYFMNSKIQKAGIILLLGILQAGVMPVTGSDLHVYKADGTKVSFTLSNVQKLTFTSSDLVVNKKAGDPESFAFTALNFFNLKDINLPTSVPAPETAVKLDVYPNPAPAEVTVASAQVIGSLILYGLQGQRLLQLAPKSSEVTLSLSPYPAGVYLLQVTDGTGTVIKKIVKN